MSSAKPKTLIRIGSLRNGGAEKTLVTLLKNLPKDKYEIDLLLNLKFGAYLSEVPDWIQLYHINEGEMITSNRPLEIPVKAYRKIKMGLHSKFPSLIYKNILKGKKYDIEIAANHVLAKEMMSSPWKTSKKIAWVHSDIDKGDFPKQDIPYLLAFDKILCISQEIFNSLKKHLPEENSKLEKFYNPIDEKEILKKSQEDISLSKPKVPVFLSVGTLYDAKGFDRLIQAHAQLLKDGLKNELWIIGDGKDKTALEDLAESLGVTASVKFLGFQKNPYPYFRMADAYVLSSRYEGFPTVLFEALVLKKNIIATEVSGAAEMLENGRLGLLVENSEEGIYQGMKQYLSEDKIFTEFQKEFQNYTPPFTLELSTQHFMNLIDELCPTKN